MLNYVIDLNPSPENAEQDWDGGDQREQCGDAGGQGPHLEDFELLSHFGPDWVLQQPRIIISGFPLSGPDLIHRPPYAVLPRSLNPKCICILSSINQGFEDRVLFRLLSFQIHVSVTHFEVGGIKIASIG